MDRFSIGWIRMTILPACVYCFFLFYFVDYFSWSRQFVTFIGKNLFQVDLMIHIINWEWLRRRGRGISGGIANKTTKLKKEGNLWKFYRQQNNITMQKKNVFWNARLKQKSIYCIILKTVLQLVTKTNWVILLCNA